MQTHISLPRNTGGKRPFLNFVMELIYKKLDVVSYLIVSKDMLMCRRVDVQMCNCAEVQMCNCSDVQKCRCHGRTANVQMCNCNLASSFLN